MHLVILVHIVLNDVKHHLVRMYDFLRLLFDEFREAVARVTDRSKAKKNNGNANNNRKVPGIGIVYSVFKENMEQP